MKTFALQGDTLDAICVRYYGALRAWLRPCSPQIRDWLNWRGAAARHRRRTARRSDRARGETVNLWE